MEEHELLRTILSKLEKMDDRLYAQTGLLEGLGRRMSSAERRIDEIEEDQKPLKRHVSMWGGAAKLLGVLGAVTGLVAGIRQMFHP